MRLLDRYLLRELLVPLGYCLSGFLLLIFAGRLVNELHGLQEKMLRTGDIALFYLVQVPEFLVMILPMALLLALLYTLTNHARHHEITAIRAAGVSLWRMCLPYVVVGFGLSLLSFALNEFYVPDSADQAEAIRNRRVPPAPDAPGRNQIRDLGFNNTGSHRYWPHIAVYNTKTGEMLKPDVLWTQPDGSQVYLRADRAAYINGVWTFYNASKYLGAAHTNSPPVLVLRTNLLAMPEFSETPEQINSEIKISSSMSLKAAKKTDVPVLAILNYRRLHSNLSRSDSAWLDTKLQGRLATPWTCLVVVLIAIPFGAASGRRNVYVGVAGSVVIFFTYWVMQQVCLALGTGSYVPPWLGGWLPNLAFGLTGLWLTARVR
ncbi:MAG TPA: LptF/LptG family permease [Candidatus Binatia bacterium]|jgi:lipopolysaccharide export system permease protein|nr:LptF/LptG family permease [Candidatus Binatia bacterium]